VSNEVLRIKAHYEIGDTFDIDARKGDSLIYPYVGDVKIKRRIVYEDNAVLPEPWHELTINCRVENARWKTTTDVSDAVNKQ
jgi:hypothetical protein